jgi:hypothetical protein
LSGWNVHGNLSDSWGDCLELVLGWVKDFSGLATRDNWVNNLSGNFLVGNFVNESFDWDVINVGFSVSERNLFGNVFNGLVVSEFTFVGDEFSGFNIVEFNNVSVFGDLFKVFHFFHFNNASFIRNVFNSAGSVHWLGWRNNSWRRNNSGRAERGLSVSNNLLFNSVNKSCLGDGDLLEAGSLDWNILNLGNWNVLDSNNLLDRGSLNN